VENVVSNRANLQIPHPRAHERQFVVHPMQDVVPQWSLRGVPVSHWVAIDDDVKVFAECGWSAS
jgi:7,8-dihydro-6-hydroxymethylpterin-pyrophosphokinase